MIPPKTVHLFSGGLDSTVLLYELLAQKHQVYCVLVAYGQMHEKELQRAMWHCDHLNLGYAFEKVTLGGSSLTGDGTSVVVPMRNAALLSIAVNVAVRAGARHVSIGCNMDDMDVFPDCRPEFFEVYNDAVRACGYDITVITPWLDMAYGKKQVVAHGRKLQVDLDSTWSCYKGGEKPCGECLACKKREEALAL